jgi:hypothetical protein
VRKYNTKALPITKFVYFIDTDIFYQMDCLYLTDVIWFIQKPKAMQSQDKALQSANKTSFWHCIFSLNHL